jgi:hypothetical protein
MKKTLTGCLSLVAAFCCCAILLFMLGGQLLPLLVGESKYVEVENKPLYKDSFYACYFSNAQPNYNRLPLFKPFALIAFNPSHKNWILVSSSHPDTRIEWDKFLNNNIKEFCVYHNYLITRSSASFKWQPPQKIEWWTIYDLNTPEDYDGKEIIWYSKDSHSQSESESFYNMLFTDELKFQQRLTELNIPQDIPWYNPNDFYQQFTKTGRCPWFPEVKQKQ